MKTRGLGSEKGMLGTYADHTPGNEAQQGGRENH